MICISGFIFILGLPLLIIYAIQPTEKKNKLWLTLGLIFMGVAIILYIFGRLAGAPI